MMQRTLLCWELAPDIVVTRIAIETPEQFIPGLPFAGAWEANLTRGTEWPYKPTNEAYKTGQSLIRTLIETRTKGGNLLLNVGPKPDGELPIEQEDRLREVALWWLCRCARADCNWVSSRAGNRVRER